MADTARIKDLASRINDLSEEELSELGSLIQAFIDDLNGDPERVVASADLSTLELVASAAESLQNERDRRSNRKSDIVNNLRAVEIPVDRRPVSRNTSFSTAVTASGRPVSDKDAVIDELSTVLRSASVRPVDGRTVVASIAAAGDAPRIPATASAEEATGILRNAITAAGGLGAPAEVRYSLPGFGESTARPLRDAFPTIVAERGSVTFLRELGLSDVLASASVWTVDDDEDALTDELVRKPRHRAPFPAEVTVSIQAIVSSIVHGNLSAKAYPEHLDRVLQLADLAYTVTAEKELLATMDALSVAVTVAAGSPALGTSRQVLPNVGLAAAGVRSRLRLASNATLQIVLPATFRDQVRADLARSQPGDRTLAMSDSEVDALFAPYHLTPVYTPELSPVAAQNAGALVLPSDTVTAYLVNPGSVSVLDSGRLSIGVYRDSDLIAANDFGVFEEGFESLVVHGLAPVKLTISGAAPTGVSRAAA